ncbi:SGNH hydrolase [Auriculariales sp. MPI-PUGE-AT-0066]|nr:SGNH hydrolase [Auriculariales sp. MPI-PUGE-AT-0066]
MAAAIVSVQPAHPLISYNGRWDADHGTWWASSGFKLSVANLDHFGLTLGPHSTAGNISIGLSVDFAPFATFNVTQGANVLPLPAEKQNDAARGSISTVRLHVQGWQNNRLQLLSIELNKGAVLLPYVKQPLVFQFIGDSLTSGQFLDNGITGNWAFIASETFKAEHRINSQPGACLTDQLCWGNYGGISGMFFKTEDTGYWYTSDHNYTTDWDFSKERPQPTHVFVEVGANDNAYNITGEAFVETYTTFLARVRELYPKAPIFVLTPWGWPHADTPSDYYFVGRYQEVVEARKANGDANVHIIDCTGWVEWDDVFPDNVHPNAAGHKKIAGLLGDELKKNGIRPTTRWLAPVV